MKLARPDVYHPRIVLAGCPQLPGGAPDDGDLVAALRGRGLHARWLAWDDPETLGADLVILRGTRDYAQRLEEFLAWARRVRNLLNAPAVVAWNADERYLTDLAAAGVPTVPGREAVSVDRDGATALVFLAGRQSHAFIERSDGPDPADPDFEVWDVGVAALAAAAHHLGIDSTELLYARVDVIGGRDDPRLLRLDLVQPSLGWRQLDAQQRGLKQRDFTLGVESALDRLGLGPLSHRRP
jgi:hypothetical protein